MYIYIYIYVYTLRTSLNCKWKQYRRNQRNGCSCNLFTEKIFGCLCNCCRLRSWRGKEKDKSRKTNRQGEGIKHLFWNTFICFLSFSYQGSAFLEHPPRFSCNVSIKPYMLIHEWGDTFNNVKSCSVSWKCIPQGGCKSIVRSAVVALLNVESPALSSFVFSWCNNSVNFMFSGPRCASNMNFCSARSPKTVISFLNPKL